MNSTASTGHSPQAELPVWKPLPDRALRSARLGGVLMALLIGLGSCVPIVAPMLAQGRLATGGALIVGAALLLVWEAMLWTWLGAAHRHTSYRIDEDGWRLRRGVLWRVETLVPRSRVQHVDVNHGPIDRHFGLATLKVHTAGTRMASVSLDGLDAREAVALRDALLTQDDDAV